MLLVAWVVRYVCTKQEIDPDGKKRLAGLIAQIAL